MACKSSKRVELRRKRQMRVRRKLRGTASCPRLCVVRSNKHLQAQLIDDDAGVTLASASTYAKESKGRPNKESARKIGALIGEKAKDKGLERVVFDRGWAKYHGVIAELASAARETGLQF